MKKVLHIIGTRPQIVKLASVINFKNITFQNLIIDTNQHYQKNMQTDLYDDFKISKEKITFLENNKNFSNDIDAIKELLNIKVCEMNPDLIIIYGDTNTTVAGALTAKENDITSIHVESGLRSYIPNQVEEKNRIFVDSISDYLFCPTLSSVKNLEKENLHSKSFFTGDIMLDIFLETKNYLDQTIGDKTFPEEFYLFTLHRKENLDNMDAFIATTGNSETNIMSCLMANSRKIKKTIALVDNMDYFNLSQSIGIDTLINKKLLAANDIFRFVRNGDIVELAKLINMDAEIVEFHVNVNSKVLDKKIAELDFPRQAIIGGVIRNGKGIIALGDFTIKLNDRVLVCSKPEALNKVESLFL